MHLTGPKGHLTARTRSPSRTAVPSVIVSLLLVSVVWAPGTSGADERGDSPSAAPLGTAASGPVPARTAGISTAQSSVIDALRAPRRPLWHPAFQPTRGSVGTTGVARIGDAFVVIGYDDQGAVVWWSDDALEWQRSPASPEMEGAMAVAIAGTPGELVMTGVLHATLEPVIWRSRDGFAWERIRIDLPSGNGFGAASSDVIRRDDGVFLAYGGDLGDGAWVLLSRDGGRTWERQPSSAWASDVHSDDEGYVGTGPAGIKVSPDGLAWGVASEARDIERLREEAWGEAWPADAISVGLEPLGEGRFVLGGRGHDTLVWSRADGLEMRDGLIDWTSEVAGKRAWAIGPDRAVLVRYDRRVPYITPPAGGYESAPPTRPPRCRPRHPELADIAPMRPAERVRCFGGRTLRFEAWVPFAELGGVCFIGDPYSWLVCGEYFPIVAGPGPGSSGMDIAIAPSLPYREFDAVYHWGAHLRVRGHFDDPAARDCPGQPNGRGTIDRPRREYVRECRQSFVVTSIRRLPYSRSGSSATRELAERFPQTIGRVPTSVLVRDGRTWLATYDPADADDAAAHAAIERFLDGLGRDVDDLSMGWALARTRGRPTAIMAVRVEGTRGAALVDAVIPFLLGDVLEPATERVTIAGEEVIRVRDAAMPGAYPRYIHPAGDVVWLVEADKAYLRDIVRDLR